MSRVYLFWVKEKTAASMGYIREGRRGNPYTIHPLNYGYAGVLNVDIGIEELRGGRGEAEVIRAMVDRGYRSGTYQVREKVRGPGRIWPSRKIQLRAGQVVNRGGFRKLMEVEI
jgi:hypothetical protein